MQACFQEYKAGKTLTDLLKWRLTYVGEELCPQHGLTPKDTLHLIPNMLQYLHGTVLNPDLAAPEDMAYFGSTCYQLCMQYFKLCVAELVKSDYLNIVEAVRDFQGFSTLTTCAGVL